MKVVEEILGSYDRTPSNPLPSTVCSFACSFICLFAHSFERQRVRDVPLLHFISNYKTFICFETRDAKL
jgi:hypothetical protein